MKAEDVSAKKSPDVRIDVVMDQYKDTVLFPRKLLLANESIRKSGHPFLSDKKEEKTKRK